MQDYKRQADKKISVTVTAEDHQFLKGLAEQAGTTQGFILHVFMEMLQLVVGAAVESGTIDEESRIPNIEAHVALTMRHMGLLADDEFERVLQLADAMFQMGMGAEHTHLRLRGLEELGNQRLAELKPIWEQSRQAAKARRAGTGWDPEVAAETARGMIEADILR